MGGIVSCAVCMVLLLTLAGQPRSLVEEAYPGVRESEGGLECCISVDVATPEEAESLRLQGIPWGRVGGMVRPFSEQLWTNLEAHGHQPRMTCFQLVEQATLEEGVERIYLSEKTETSAGRPMVAWSRGHPVPQFKLLFLGGRPTPIEILPYEEYYTVSENGQFASVASSDPEADEPNMGRWKVFKSSGQKTGELPVILIYDEPPDQIVLSDKGNWIELINNGREAGFYDSTGNLIRRVTVSDLPPIRCLAHFSADGRYVALAIQPYPSPQGEQESKDCILLYDSEGRRIWEFSPSGIAPFTGRAWVSQGGAYVIGSFRVGRAGEKGYEHSAYILDKRGSVVAKIDGFDFHVSNVKFSTSLTYAVLRSSKELLVVKPQTGEVIMRHREPGTSVIDFDLAEKAQVLGLTIDTEVLLLDLQARGFWFINPGGREWGRAPHISLSDDGNEMSLSMGDKFFLYKRVQER